MAEKNFSGPTYDTSYLSYGSYDLQLSSYHKNFQNEVKWRQLNYTKYTWLADERSTLSVQNVSWNTGDPNRIIYLYKIIINQSIIRCNTSIRHLIKIKDKCINKIEIRMRMYNMLQLPAGSLVNHHFRNRIVDREVFQVFL